MFYPIWSTTQAANTSSANQLMGEGNRVRVTNQHSSQAATVNFGGSNVAATAASFSVNPYDVAEFARPEGSTHIAYYAGAEANVNMATGYDK